MAEIMNILRADHRTMARLLDNLESQIAPLCGEAVPNYDLLNEAVNYCLTYPDLYHHPKEDQVYRRLIEKGVSPDQLGDLETAHQDLSGLTHRLAQKLKSAQSAEPVHRKILASLIESFVKSYRLHLEAEDKVFFPLAEEKLEPADWAAIDAEMARMPDPLFGDRAPLDYPSLYPVMLGGKAQ